MATYTVTINKAKLTVTGLTAEKVYDNTNVAKIDFTKASLATVYNSDDVHISSVTGTYTSVDIGEGIVINVTEVALVGTAAGNYEVDEFTINGKITPAHIKNIEWKVGGENAENTYTYDGEEHTLTATGTWYYGDDEGSGAQTIELSVKRGETPNGNFKDVAVYNFTAEITGNDNLALGEVTASFNITVNKAKLTIDELENYIYNGEDQFPEISEDIKAKVKNEETSVIPSDVEVTEQSIVDVNTYRVEVKLSADDGKNFEFDGSDSTTVTVEVKQAKVTSITWEVSDPAEGALSGNNYNAVYDGKKHTVTATLTLNGDEEYTVEVRFDDDIIKDVDTYNITVEGTDNYAVSADNAEFTAVISAYKIKDLTKPEKTTYNGSVQEAEELATLNGVNGETLSLGDDYTVEYSGKEKGGKTPQNADTYTVTVKLTSSATAKNYELELPLTEYIIEKAKLDRPTSTADENAVSGVYKSAAYGIEISGFTDSTMTVELSDGDKSQFNAEDGNYKFTATDASDTPYTLTVKITDQSNYEWQDGESGDVVFTITIEKAEIKDNFGEDGKLVKKQEYLYHADDVRHELKLNPGDDKFPLGLQGSDKLTDEEIKYIIEPHSEADHSGVDMDRRLDEYLKNSDLWKPYSASDDSFFASEPRHYVVYFKVEAQNGNYNEYYGYFTVLIFNEKVTITLKSGSNLPDVEYGEVDHTKQSLIDDVFDMIEKVEISADDGSLKDDTESWKNKLKDETEHDKFEFYFRTGKTVEDGVRYEVGEYLSAGKTYYLFLQYIDGNESYITFEWKIGDTVERPGFNVIARKINITVDVEGHVYGDIDFTDKVTMQTPVRADGKTWYGEDKDPGIESLGITYTYELDGAEYTELSKDMPAGEYTVKFKYTNANYDITFAADKYVVDTAELEFTITPPSVEYDGDGHDVEVLFDGLKNGDILAKDVDYTIEITGDGVALVGDKPQNVGKYTVKVTLNTESSETAKNYTVTTESQTFTILVGKIEKPSGENFKGTYTGGAQGLTLKNFTYNAAAMECEYSDNSNFATDTGVFGATNAGVYTLTIRLKEGYQWSDGENGELTFTVTIDKATLTITGATIETRTYDGTKTATVLTMTFDGIVESDEGEVEFDSCAAEFESPNANLNATVNKITDVKLKGAASDNYVVDLETLPEITGRIERAKLTIEFTVEKKPYDGTTAATVTGEIAEGKVSSDDVTVGEIKASFNSANAGVSVIVTIESVTLEGSAKDNYTVDLETLPEITGEIEKANLTVSVSDNEKSYSGETQTATVTVTGINEQKLESGYTVTYKLDGAGADVDPLNAGTYHIYITLSGDNAINYNEVTVSEQLTISPAKIGVVWNGGEEIDLEYNGNPKTITASATGVKGEPVTLEISYASDSPDVDLVADEPLNAGAYTATATTLNGNYELTGNTITYTVAKQTVTAPVIESVVYNGNPHTAYVETSALYSAAEVTETNAGDYPVAITLIHPENYKWATSEEAAITVIFTIKKAIYDMSGVTFGDLTLDYDGEEHSIFISGDLPIGVEVTYDGNGQKEVGEYTVTAYFTGDAQNYELIPEKTAKLTILRVSHNLDEIKFEDVTVKYDGETHSIYIEGVLPHGVTVEYLGNGQAEPNIYTVTAVFSDHIGEFARKTATLTILRTHTQSAESDVVIDSEEGFDPTLELTIEKSEYVERGYWLWQKDQVTDKYAVKMYKNGEEVPIDGKVTVRLLIPEEFRDKDFEIKSVTRGASVEFTRDGDYVVFEADGLSAYIFTSSYTPYFPVVFIATGVMLAAVAVLIVLAVVLKKKKNTKVK